MRGLLLGTKNGFVRAALLLITAMLASLLLSSCSQGDGNASGPENEPVQLDAVDEFVEAFNAKSAMAITNVELIDDIQDKSSEFYRTEFRLNAFDDALAKHGLIGDNQVLIVSYEGPTSENMRFYADIADLEAAVDATLAAIQVLDPSVSEEGFFSEMSGGAMSFGSVNGVDITEQNGTYFGESRNIGITFFRKGSLSEGYYYEIMVKKE